MSVKDKNNIISTSKANKLGISILLVSALVFISFIDYEFFDLEHWVTIALVAIVVRVIDCIISYDRVFEELNRNKHKIMYMFERVITSLIFILSAIVLIVRYIPDSKQCSMFVDEVDIFIEDNNLWDAPIASVIDNLSLPTCKAAMRSVTITMVGISNNLNSLVMDNADVGNTTTGLWIDFSEYTASVPRICINIQDRLKDINTVSMQSDISNESQVLVDEWTSIVSDDLGYLVDYVKTYFLFLTIFIILLYAFIIKYVVYFVMSRH